MNDFIDNHIAGTLRATVASPTARAALDGALADIKRTASAASATTASSAARPARAAASTFAAQPAWAADRRRAVPRRPLAWGRVAAAVAIASLGVGGTAFAADALGLIDLRWSGAHQVMIGVEGEGDDAMPGQVDGYRLELAYEPTGLADEDAGFEDEARRTFVKFLSEDAMRSLSVDLLYRDSDDAFAADFVTGAEPVSVGGRGALLTTTQNLPQGEARLELFIPFDEENRIVVVSADESLRDEMLRVAEGVSLAPTGETVARDDLWLWSQFMTPATGYAEPVEGISATAAQMGNLHQIGEEFPLSNAYSGLFDLPEDAAPALTATVEAVEVADDLSPLALPEIVGEDWRSLVGSDGKLGDDTLTFTKWGDGKDTLDEVVAEVPSPVALVHATVKYANVSDKVIGDFIYNGYLASVTEDAEGWEIYDRTAAVSDADTVESIATTSMERTGYGDVEGRPASGSPDNPNHVRGLAPGETATVHMAWLVPRDELSQILLVLNGNGSLLNADNLAVGLVDIRQDA